MQEEGNYELIKCSTWCTCMSKFPVSLNFFNALRFWIVILFKLTIYLGCWQHGTVDVQGLGLGW